MTTAWSSSRSRPTVPTAFPSSALPARQAATFRTPAEAAQHPVVKGCGGSYRRSWSTSRSRTRELCPRYTARMVKNVKIAPSPKWMRERLRNVRRAPDQQHRGYHELRHARVRPADARVRLLPAWTAARSSSAPRVRARSSRPSTATTASSRRTCSASATSTSPSRVAGVMGGANSEIVGDTAMVLFESANFNGALRPPHGGGPRHAHRRLRAATKRVLTR